MDQHDASHEHEWHAETKKPSGYQVLPGSLYQKAKQIYPAGDQKSWIEPYEQRDHAWNMDQHDASHEHEWQAETAKPSGYQVLPGSLSQHKYRHDETHSKIEPYKVRDHAWNFDHHDATHIEEYKKDAPKGYSEQMDYMTPNPTNLPYKKPVKIAPMFCDEEAALNATKLAKTCAATPEAPECIKAKAAAAAAAKAAPATAAKAAPAPAPAPAKAAPAAAAAPAAKV